MDGLIHDLTGVLISSISVISVVLIVVGVIIALYTMLSGMHKRSKVDYYAKTRLVLSRYLLLALEFQIAADILWTVLEPSWEEFGRLAATIAVRSVLSYILMLEGKAKT